MTTENDVTQTLDEIIKPDEVLQAERDPNNAGNPVSVRAKQKKVDEKAKRRRAVIGALLESLEGREFLSFLMFELGGLYQPLGNAAFDTQGLYFREGARHIALALDIECLRADSTRYMQMRKEFENLK